MSKILVRQGYNKAAEEYLENRDQFKNIKYLEKLVKLLKPKAKILDLGCGAGKPIDKFLVSKGFEILGIDVSEKQIELAKKNVLKGRFKAKDMSDLKKYDYKVDAVISFYAIFHTPRETHQELFKKINSFLPKGGMILVTMGSSKWEGVQKGFHGVEMYWSYYGSKENKTMVEKAGFKILLDEINPSDEEKHQVIMAKKVR